MTWAVAAVLLWSVALQSAPSPQRPVEGMARAALVSMASGDFGAVEAQFTDAMKKAWPAAKLAAAWAGLSTLGPHGGCRPEVRVVRIDDKQMVISSCRFGEAPVDIQFAFNALGRISGLAIRPGSVPAASALPRYADPAAFADEEVSIGSEWALPGTLSLPKTEGRHPAVILVHGSGPADRDAGFGPNKPFRDLAAGLASKGIAVLRYDKRSKVHGARLAGRIYTVKDVVIDDVLEAMEVLRRHPRIDPARVFVLGHSLGGMLIPRIASMEPRAAGWIVSAGAARPIEEAIVTQARYLASADGTVTSDEQKTIDDMVAAAARISALKPEDAASTEAVQGAPPAHWLDLRNYDAPSAAKGIKGRMLILQGERDYQVTMEDFARWKKALANRSDVTFRTYPALNHLLVAGSGPSLPAEYLKPGHVDEQVVRDIADWILRRPSSPR